MASKLTDVQRELGKKGAQAAAQTRAQQMNSFAQVAFVKNPDIAPPKPVLQDVGMAAFMDALSIGTSLATTAGSLGWKPITM